MSEAKFPNEEERGEAAPTKFKENNNNQTQPNGG
jgi:hypothetical protein